MTEEVTQEVAKVEEPAKDDDKPKRRGRPRKEADGEVPFKPTVTSIHANAKRVIRTAQFESLEIMCHVEAVPDPKFSPPENLHRLTWTVVNQAEEIATVVKREIEVGK